MSKHTANFLPRTISDKLWLGLLLAPPAIYLLYFVVRFILSYDGRYHGVLQSGPECTLLQFVLSELTSTFFFPGFVLITLYWVTTMGVVYFGVKIFKRFPN